MRRGGPPGRGGGRQRRPRRARGRRARQRPGDRGCFGGGPPGRRQADRLRLDDLGLLGLRAARSWTRTRCCRRPRISTRAPSWPASSTARPTRSCTGSTTRSCASASRTVHARARPRSSRRSSNKALRGEPLTLAGDGGQSRRFVYVEDLAEGVALGLSDVAENRVYNLASDENVTIKQIAVRVQELLGDVEIVYTPARPGDFNGKVVLSDRARSASSGWTARTPFSEGVRRYVEWRRDQAARAAECEAAVGDPRRRARHRVRPAQDPDHLGRHRRGSRPAGARGGARVPRRGSRRATSRSSTACPRWAGS